MSSSFSRSGLAGQHLDPRTPHHDRRVQARLRQTHRRRHPVLRLRPHQQEGSAARADHGASAGGLHHGGGRQPCPDDGPARGQIQGFFNIPVDELTAETILARYIFAKELDDFTVVATNTGFAKKARNFAERLNAPLAIVEKRRVGNHGKTETLGLIGSVAGRHAIIVDDEIDTTGSVIQAANLVRREGARDVYACAMHGVLSDDAINRIANSVLRELVITDTIPLPPEKQLPVITVLSVAELFAGAIERIHEGKSVAELFR